MLAGNHEVGNESDRNIFNGIAVTSRVLSLRRPHENKLFKPFQ